MLKNIEKFRKTTFAFIIALILVMTASGCQFLENDDDTDDQTQEDQQKVVLINLGDSYANGVQSNKLNEYNQIFGYPQVIADQMDQVVDLTWNNPLMNTSTVRIDSSSIPYNLGVSGATVQSLLTETTDSYLVGQLLAPIQTDSGSAVTQLEAAEYVASLHSDETIKIITIFIGGNDILGPLIAENGTKLSATDINAFLSDTSAGHDLTSMTENLTTIINRLAAIPNSHIFLANLPSVAGIAGLFSNSDLQNLASYSNPSVNGLASDEYFGLGAVLGGLGDFGAGALAANDPTLNGTIAGIKASDADLVLTGVEKQLIEDRTDDINEHIQLLDTNNENVYMVDMVSFFDLILSGDVIIDGDVIDRGYGGGLFSYDGFHPSHTGYALLADEFIKKINELDLITEIDQVDLESVMASDPYHDFDGDGYVPGPSNYDMFDILYFNAFRDCDDTDASISAPFPSTGVIGFCS